MNQVEQPNVELVAEDEEFKVAKIYDEYYENYLISNYGRVYSKNVNRIIYFSIDQYGYTRFKLHKNGKTKYISGQRLVAFAFVPNGDPEKYNTVNHKDEFDKTNNKWTNLEWCDDKWNINWATAQKRRAAKRSKKVFQYDLNNNLIAEYESLPDLFAKTGYYPSTMCGVCRKEKIYKGYYWKYKESA